MTSYCDASSANRALWPPCTRNQPHHTPASGGSRPALRQAGSRQHGSANTLRLAGPVERASEANLSPTLGTDLHRSRARADDLREQDLRDGPGSAGCRSQACARAAPSAVECSPLATRSTARVQASQIALPRPDCLVARRPLSLTSSSTSRGDGARRLVGSWGCRTLRRAVT